MGAQRADVVKLPKEYRVAQRWRAECDLCMGVGRGPNVRPRGASVGIERWRDFMRRSKSAAQRDADAHNAKHHPAGEEQR